MVSGAVDAPAAVLVTSSSPGTTQGAGLDIGSSSCLHPLELVCSLRLAEGALLRLGSELQQSERRPALPSCSLCPCQDHRQDMSVSCSEPVGGQAAPAFEVLEER